MPTTLWILKLSLGGLLAMADSTSEVLQLEKEFLSAWNHGDTAAVVALYAEDGVRVGAFGDIARGREELRLAYDQLFHGGPLKSARAEVTPTARKISDTVVLVEGPLTITPSQPGLPALRGYALDIWNMTAHGWRILESHPKFYPTRP